MKFLRNVVIMNAFRLIRKENQLIYFNTTRTLKVSLKLLYQNLFSLWSLRNEH